MAAKKGIAPKVAVEPAPGTHVVAIVVGDETLGYQPILGMGTDQPVSHDHARRYTPDTAEIHAGMLNSFASKAKKPERYVVREAEELAL